MNTKPDASLLNDRLRKTGTMVVLDVAKSDEFLPHSVDVGVMGYPKLSVALTGQLFTCRKELLVSANQRNSRHFIGWLLEYHAVGTLNFDPATSAIVDGIRASHQTWHLPRCESTRVNLSPYRILASTKQCLTPDSRCAQRLWEALGLGQRQTEKRGMIVAHAKGN